MEDMKRGEDSYLFNVGDKIISNGYGTYKAGLIGTVLLGWMQNGYVKYKIGWDNGGTTIERLGDITALE